MKKPLMLIIMDGFGINEKEEHFQKIDAIKSAKTQNLDKIFKSNPYTLIKASGKAVGLPKGQMGNSEVGHMTMGSGRIIYQDFTRISNSIENDEFFQNEILNGATDHALKNNSSLHLMGLLSPGGVHSHTEHLYALLRLAKERGIKKVFIHAFLDGRDTSPNSGIDFINDCKGKLQGYGIGKIATICGRYYAMDRDNRWDRIEKAYNLLVEGIGEKTEDPILTVRDFYEKNITDEFMSPILVDENGLINDNDSVIFFNFRPDRARELTRAFTEENFEGFKRHKKLKNLHFVSMTQYDKNFKGVEVAFPECKIKDTLGEVLSKSDFSQLRIAETEKYAHVTFFFNAGNETPFLKEDRILVPSPKVATYDLQPEMSADEITEKTLKDLENLNHDVIILNFANCDMVGHTGDFVATVKAVEKVDECVGKIIEKIKEKNGVAIITADHGNAEKMQDENGEIFTAHTTNKVPFCVVGYNCRLKNGGGISNIAPTILEILNIEKPNDMTEESLIEKTEER